MSFDPAHNPDNDPASHVSRGLVISLLIGAVAFLALVVWFLRMGGGIWG